MTINKAWLSIKDAKNRIIDALEPIQETESLPLEALVDRVLAQDIVSPLNVPAFDNSAMDGYAINSEHLQTTSTFKLVGKSFAGKPYTATITSGECVRIMTGAMIPEGADAVVMQENAQADGDTITILSCKGKGEAIRPQGDDIQKGEVVLKAGTRITPVSIGVLASLGIAQASVYRKLGVAIFSTGDELTPLGQALKEGHIYDTNRPMLAAMLQRLDAEVINLGIVADNKDAIKAAFQRASEAADCIITSGGVSVGEADFTREILEQEGKIDFWKIAIKPGKPLAFGKIYDTVFFGLPGNPVSSAVTFDQIAVPALQLMSGELAQARKTLTAKAANSFKKRPGRTDFQRATLVKNDKGELLVSSAKNQSSGVLSSYTKNNCYLVLEQERADVNAGEEVEVLMFDKPLM